MKEHFVRTRFVYAIYLKKQRSAKVIGVRLKTATEIHTVQSFRSAMRLNKEPTTVQDYDGVHVLQSQNFYDKKQIKMILLC